MIFIWVLILKEGQFLILIICI